MKETIRLLVLFLVIVWMIVLASVAFGKPKIEGKPVEYTSGGVVLKGYLAYDENIKGKRPGVLIVHEWWGQNEYVRKRARMLAGLGYTALALDMYGEGKIADHPDDAKKFSSEVMKNLPAARERFLAAVEVLKKDPTVDPDRIAAIGYCFGGGVVLNMAVEGVDMKGVASFHASLGAVKPDQAPIKAAVRVYNGADDKYVTPEQIEAFKKEMAAQKVNFKFENYPGAVHGFSNPDATEIGKKFQMGGYAYNAKADKASWKDLQQFLKEIFKK